LPRKRWGWQILAAIHSFGCLMGSTTCTGLNVDSSDRQPGEAWPAFVMRSAAEVLEKFKEKIVKVDYLNEIRQWPALRKKVKRGPHALDSLCFVISLASESKIGSLSSASSRVD